MENQQELQQLVIQLKAEVYDVSKAFHSREKQLLEHIEAQDKTIEQLQQEIEDLNNRLSDEVIDEDIDELETVEQ